MMDYCVMESKINAPVYSGEELRNPVREASIASYADNTAGALKEANLALDKIFENLFGPCAERVQEQHIPPVGCLEQQMQQNAEVAMVTANRICELVGRMFGK